MPREDLKNKTIDFSISFEEFTEKEDKKGCFEGLLVNYNHKNLAHGYYKFSKGSLKANEGKIMLLLYNHSGDKIPVGTCKGVDTEQGFKIEAQLQLSTDDNGNCLNKEAFALYDLMKNQGAKFELSAGGMIEEGESREVTENGKTNWFYEIKKFNAYEGSITPKGAVHGSKITKIFNEGEDKMNPQEQKLFIEAIIGAMQKELFSAYQEKEILELPNKIAELEKKFTDIKETLTEDVKEAFNEQFNEINNVIKGLKSDFKPTETQVSFADEFMAAFKEIRDDGGKLKTITSETVLKFSATPGTTTGEGTKAGVRAHQLLGIFKRLQEVNPVVADLNIINITDNSLDLDREEIGLPEVAWIGEEDERVETEGNKLKDVNIQLHQIYALPKISNKLMATNYVGYVSFLMSRVEYAWALKIANTMFNGTGTKQPLGILNDTTITNVTEWDLSTMTPIQKIDALATLFGNTRDEISSKAKWYMRRETWTELTLLKDKNERLQLIDIKNGGERKLLSRPVVIIDSANSGLKTMAEAAAGEPFMVLGDFKTGMLGITNSKLNLAIKDQITGKGWTAYYMEKGLGFGVVYPENFAIIKNKNS